jgi:outer membrane protein TolC
VRRLPVFLPVLEPVVPVLGIDPARSRWEAVQRGGIRVGWAATLCAVASILAVTPARSQEPGLEIGAIGDVDLDAMRRIIDASDDPGPPLAVETRSLSLEGALKVALENNLRLQIFELEVDQGTQEIRAAKAKFHPSVAAEGGGSGSKTARDIEEDEERNNQRAEVFIDQEVPTGGQVRVGAGYRRNFSDLNAEDPISDPNVERTTELAGLSIELRQPLLKGGRTYVARREILFAGYDDEINRAELNKQVLSVTAETKAAYYNVVRAQRQVEVIQKALMRDDELVRASRALFDAGRVSKVDVYSAEIRKSNDLSRLASSEADHEQTQNELRKVLGLPIEVEIEVTDLTIPFQPIQITLDDWIRRAIENRPEMIRLRKQLEKADLAIKLRKNARLPSLDVTGGYRPGFDWKSYDWQAGVEFDYPIGNVAARSRLKQSEIERARVHTEYVRQKRAIDVEVRESEIKLRESVARLRNLTGQVANSRSKGEIARGRFEMGLADNRDLREADEELVRSESQLLEALVDYVTNIAVLEARIAGPL